jgi:uncharacterized membrane protein
MKFRILAGMAGAGLSLLAIPSFAQVGYSVTEIRSPGAPVVVDVRDLNAYGHVTGQAWRMPRMVAFYWDGTAVRDISPPSAWFSAGSAMNDAGQVAITASIDTDSRTFRWTAGTLTAVGASLTTTPFDINASGTIVGRWNPPGTVELRPFRDDGTFHDLPTLGGPEGTAAVINDAGQIGGHVQAASQPYGLPVIWTNDAPLFLGLPQHFTSGEVRDIDAYGRAVCRADRPEANWTAALRWTGTHLEFMATLGGPAFPVAMNDANQAVGESLTADRSAYRAVLWNGNFVVDLGAPGSYSNANDINASGTVVGRYMLAGEPMQFYGFVWAGTLRTLDDTVHPADPLHRAVRFTDATKINDAGQILAAGFRPEDPDTRRFYVLTPWGSRYAFGGFLRPLERAPAVNVVNAGAAVPVKFSLGGYRGLGVFAAGYPVLVPASCTHGTPTGASVLAVTSGRSGLQYERAPDTYTFVWKTERAWTGTCGRLDVRFADGSATHSVLFRFR